MTPPTTFLPERFRPTPQPRTSPRRIVLLALVPALVTLLPLWRLQAVEVSPDTPVPEATRTSLAELEGSPMMLVDLARIHRLVECWPAAHRVDISLSLAGTLTVHASSAETAGSVRRGHGWQAVSVTGQLGARLDAPRTPLLDGFPPSSGELRRALAVVERLGDSGAGEVELLRRITPSDLEVHLRPEGSEAPLVIHVRPEGSAAERAWSEAVRRGSVPAWADARSDHRLVVRGWS